MGNKQGRRCHKKSVKENETCPEEHSDDNNTCSEQERLILSDSDRDDSNDSENVTTSVNQDYLKHFNLTNHKLPLNDDESIRSSNTEDENAKKCLDNVHESTNIKSVDNIYHQILHNDSVNLSNTGLDKTCSNILQAKNDWSMLDTDTKILTEKQKCVHSLLPEVDRMKDNKVKSKPVEEQASDNKISEKDMNINPVEKLSSIIKELSQDDVNWLETISKISKIVRNPSDARTQSHCISVLIDQQITQRLMDYLEKRHIKSLTDLKLNVTESCKENPWSVVKKFLTLFWIVCDQNVNFCQHILTTHTFEFLIIDFKRICLTTYQECDVQTFIIKATLGILHNVSRLIPNSKWTLRNLNLVSDVKSLLTSEVPMIRLKSLIVLSYILSEAENELINSDNDNFVFIFQVLNDALNSTQHKSTKYGMNVAEVLKGLNNLAINDENKIRIVQNGGLALFQEILNEGYSDEIKVTITTLWSLAFHHYNKVKMRELPGIMTKLNELQQCDNEEISHAARGTFWELENTSKSSLNTSLSSSLSADKDPNQPHIMISYQWDSQAVMMKVKDRLRQAGYKVWMDIEHMTGSTLEAMALAVEKSAVILVCMSQKYKDSPNCRTEAEYVYRLRKDFVPLRLQREYIPDGWLGILVGTRLYFDIYEEDQLDIQIPRLVRELRNRGKIQALDETMDSHVPIVPERLNSREAVPLLHQPASPTVKNWTCLDVKQWLISHGLEYLTTVMEQFDGHLLTELKNIQDTAPEYFHSILRQDLKLELVPSLKLSKCLRHLS
ncbi:hypothetical protein ACF0H5_011787 [Mactra antiquata]